MRIFGSRRGRGVFVAAMLIVAARAEATVTQVDGTIVPVGSNLQAALNTYEPPNGTLNSIQNAAEMPQIFKPRLSSPVVFLDIREGAGFENSFGWYNIDRMLENMDGVKMSTLTVQWETAHQDHVNIFLLIPSARILQEGGPLEDGSNKSGFYTTDGMAPLPQGVKALILALGEKDGQPLLGVADFITSETQTFNLQIHPLSKEKLNTYLRQLDLQEITIKLEDSKNAQEIRARDAELKDLEKLKPTSCDCSCSNPDKPQDETPYLSR